MLQIMQHEILLQTVVPLRAPINTCSWARWYISFPEVKTQPRAEKIFRTGKSVLSYPKAFLPLLVASKLRGIRSPMFFILNRIIYQE